MNRTLQRWKLLLIAALGAALVGPLAALGMQARSAEAMELLRSRRFVLALGRSAASASLAALCSVGLALGLAWCLGRSGVRRKGVYRAVLGIPMLIPSISHGMGLVLLLGRNGMLTRLLRLPGTIYGLWGIVAGSVLYSFPVALLMLEDALRYEDAAPYEAADALGIPKWRQFFSLTLPYLRRPLCSALFAAFTLSVTDYGVPLVVGGRYETLAVMMYQEVIGRLRFGEGSLIGAVLLIPAVSAFLFDALWPERESGPALPRPFRVRPGPVRDAVCRAALTAACVLLALPVASFALLTLVRSYPNDMSLTLANARRAMQLGAGRYLGHSLVLAAGTAAAGTALCWLTAYAAVRTGPRLSRALHLIATAPLAVPGLALGLGYSLALGAGARFGGMGLLILVNVVHFFAAPYLMARHAMEKLSGGLEAVGQTLGVGRAKIMRDVVLPQTAATLPELFAYFFVNAMITISAVSFLSTPGTMPLSLLLTRFESQNLMECASFVSLLLLGVNLLARGASRLLGRLLGRAGEEDGRHGPDAKAI